MNYRFCIFIVLIVLQSCASKKKIHYIQDANTEEIEKIQYQKITVQPNDILKITVESLIPEAALPYNKASLVGGGQANVELLKLNGYLVSVDNTINLPILGEVSTKNKNVQELESIIKDLLEKGGHLVNPSVNVRIINAKVTILGEVNSPGTYNFTEQSITLIQALGYAGDLTINGKRDDITIIRELDGVRKISHIDITSTEFMNSEYYFIKPNDQIIINQNDPKVKSAGYIGNLGTLLSVASIALSTIVLLTTR